jgi:hypothetical protein
MTVCAAAGGKQVRCAAVPTVNTDELLASIADIDNANPESARLICELVAGHEGSHIALVATAHGGDQWWWLRWDGQLGEPKEVVHIEPCDAELPHERYADDCLLPEGHPGPHSFDLPPLA